MTPAEAKAFWHFPDLEDSPPEPATDAMIQEFNERHLLRLPDSFVALYQVQNGGLSPTHYQTFWSINDDVCPLTTLDQVCDGRHDDEIVGMWTKELEDLSRLVVFFGDGHFYFALNFNDLQEDEPIVWYLDDNGAKRTGMRFEPWLASEGGGSQS